MQGYMYLPIPPQAYNVYPSDLNTDIERSDVYSKSIDVTDVVYHEEDIEQNVNDQITNSPPQNKKVGCVIAIVLCCIIIFIILAIITKN